MASFLSKVLQSTLLALSLISCVVLDTSSGNTEHWESIQILVFILFWRLVIGFPCPLSRVAGFLLTGNDCKILTGLGKEVIFEVCARIQTELRLLLGKQLIKTAR